MARVFADDEQAQDQAEPTTQEETPQEETPEVISDADTLAASTDEASTQADEDTSEQDWAAFEKAVQGTLTHEARDESTGDIPAHVSSPALIAYKGLKGSKLKKKAREFLQEGMSQGMISGDSPAARTYLEVLKAIEAGGSVQRETPVRAPVDPTEAHVAAVTAMMLAANLVQVPEGVAEDWAEKVNAKTAELSAQVIAYRDWIAGNAGKAEDDRTAAPEVDPIVLVAAKIASGRAASVRKASSGTPRAASTGGDGKRHDIAEHIRQAFAGVDSGTFLSVGDIVKFKSTEYGDNAPSQGAVAARLFPGGDPGKCNLDFVTPAEQGKKGAIKK